MYSPLALHPLVHPAELRRLRWAVVAGQAAAALTAVSLDPAAPRARLFTLVSAAALSQLFLAMRGFAPGPRAVLALIGLDALLLTGLLAITGAGLSPFTALYLVFPVMAALVLSPAGAWGATAGVLGAYGLLLFVPAGEHADHPGMGGPGSHAAGMFAAVALASPFLVQTLLRTRRALTLAEEERARARAADARATRLTSLATLAAGAAHELSSPLGTIAVAAKEIERRAGECGVLDDARLIGQEVRRCRQVLDELSADVGSGAAEAARPVSVGDLVDLIVHDQPDVELELPQELEEVVVRLPPRLVAQAARRLLGNARDASPPGRAPSLKVELDGEILRLIAEDHGEGMTPEVLARAGEPFFTTKPEGAGRGLGLWFTRSVASSVGGALTLGSRPGEGTRATLEVPVKPASKEENPDG